MSLEAAIQEAYDKAAQAVDSASTPFAQTIAVKAISLLLDLVQRCNGIPSAPAQQTQGQPEPQPQPQPKPKPQPHQQPQPQQVQQPKQRPQEQWQHKPAKKQPTTEQPPAETPSTNRYAVLGTKWSDKARGSKRSSTVPAPHFAVAPQTQKKTRQTEGITRATTTTTLPGTGYVQRVRRAVVVVEKQPGILPGTFNVPPTFVSWPNVKACDAEDKVKEAFDKLEEAGTEVEAGYAVVCAARFEGSAQHVVAMDDGSLRPLYVRMLGTAAITADVPAGVHELAETSERRAQHRGTKVLRFAVAAKYASEATWKRVRLSVDSGEVVKGVCRRACRDAGVDTVTNPDIWDISTSPGTVEASVRVRSSEVRKLLLASGKGGCFWKLLSFSRGRDEFAVVGLKRGTSLPDALQKASLLREKALGLALGDRCMFVRVAAGDGVDVREALGDLAVDKREPRQKWLVSGGLAGEHREDIVFDLREAGWTASAVSTWCRSDDGEKRRFVVVAADAQPQMRYLKRAGLTPLWIRPYSREERGGVSVNRVWAAKQPDVDLPRSRVKLPKRDAPVPSPDAANGGENADVEMETDDATDLDHDCVFSGKGVRAKKAFVCDGCQETRNAGLVARICEVEGCESILCATCARSHATPTTK